MKNSFLSAAALAVLLSACGGQQVAKIKYDASKHTIFAGYNASMGEIYSSKGGKPTEGGSVLITDPPNSPSGLDRYLNGEDPKGIGHWEQITVCGFILRYDGKSACGNLVNLDNGEWLFTPGDRDVNMVDKPSDQRIAYWVHMLDDARNQLAKVPSQKARI